MIIIKMGNEEYNDKILGIVIIILLGLMLIFMLCFYEFYKIPKDIKIKDKECVNYLVAISNSCINFIENRTTDLTPEEYYRLKVLKVKLNEIAESM